MIAPYLSLFDIFCRYQQHNHTNLFDAIHTNGIKNIYRKSQKNKNIVIGRNIVTMLGLFQEQNTPTAIDGESVSFYLL